MPAEYESPSMEEQGMFTSPTSGLPCESCSACGLCNITNSKIDFMGNLNDLSAVPTEQQAKIQTLFKMAGFEQKVKNWDDSVGNEGKFSFERFGRKFQGTLTKQGDITLTVEIVQTTAISESAQQPVIKEQPKITPSPTREIHIKHPESQTQTIEELQPEKIVSKPKKTETKQKKVQSEPPIEQRSLNHANNSDSQAENQDMSFQKQSNTSYEYALEDIHVRPEYRIPPFQIELVDGNETNNIVTELNTVLPSDEEAFVWIEEIEKPEWKLQDITEIYTESADNTTETVSTDRDVDPITPADDPTANQVELAIESINQLITTVNVSESKVIVEPYQPRTELSKLVQTHIEARQALFSFISTLIESEKIIKDTIDQKDSHDEVYEITPTESTTTKKSHETVTQIESDNQVIIIELKGNSESVIRQYLIGAEATIINLTGMFQINNQSHHEKVSIQTHTEQYALHDGSQQWIISLIITHGNPIKLVAPPEAIKILKMRLSEYLKPTILNIDGQYLQAEEEKIYEDTNIQSTNFTDTYTLWLIYTFLISITSEHINIYDQAFC